MAAKKVLVCPLDWGLGHATRSIPIIQALLNRGCEVGIASSGSALALLQIEFPELTSYSLTGYRPYYSASSMQMVGLLRQFPKFVSTIRKEHNETEEIIRRDSWDIVISDNRFGCWSAYVPSVIITHQINIPVPFAYSIINFFNHQAIKRFSFCWIPDRPGSESLSGPMVEPNGFPVSFVGHLSRFKPISSPKTFDIVAMISGPEPHRSKIESILRDQLKQTTLTSLLICGNPGNNHQILEGTHQEAGHLPADQLNRVLAGAGLVICRSGYSTVMDLMAIGKKAVFVPTPGQPEQEYLAATLMSKGIAYSVSQEKFDLKALEKANDYSGLAGSGDSGLLDHEIDALISL